MVFGSNDRTNELCSIIIEAQLEDLEIIELIHIVERNETNAFELRERGKLSLKLFGLLKILRRVGELAYELALP